MREREVCVMISRARIKAKFNQSDKDPQFHVSLFHSFMNPEKEDTY